MVLIDTGENKGIFGQKAHQGRHAKAARRGLPKTSSGMTQRTGWISSASSPLEHLVQLQAAQW